MARTHFLRLLISTQLIKYYMRNNIKVLLRERRAITKQDCSESFRVPAEPLCSTVRDLGHFAHLLQIFGGQL